jgi:hypothetical protein
VTDVGEVLGWVTVVPPPPDAMLVGVVGRVVTPVSPPVEMGTVDPLRCSKMSPMRRATPMRRAARPT